MIKNTDISDLNAAEEQIMECKSITLGGLQSPVMNVQVDIKSVGSASPKKETADKLSHSETKLANKRIHLDCLICLSLINFEWHEWQDATNQLKQAYQVSILQNITNFIFEQIAKTIGESGLAEMCLCNNGVAQANQAMETGGMASGFANQGG